MSEILWNNWLIVAFAAPFFWTLVHLIDVYVVHGIYEDAYDGSIIAGLFQLLPWFLVPFGVLSYNSPAPQAFFLLFLSGFLFLYYQFFYFKALFASHDVTVISVLSNLNILVVPFFAWFLIGEILSLKNYMGLFIAFLGATLFYLHKNMRERNFSNILFLMTVGTFLISLSMVFAEKGYSLAGTDFWSGFLTFCLGGGAGALFFVLTDKKTVRDRAKHLLVLSKRYLIFFLIIELLQVCGELVSQRAIDISPAVSYVAVIEGVSPVYVLAISFLILGTAYLFHRKKNTTFQAIYRDQVSGWGLKMISAVILLFGIYLIS